MSMQHANGDNDDTQPTNLVATTSKLSDEAIAWINQHCAGQRIVYFSMDNSAEEGNIPDSWQRLPIGELADEDLLRNDLLEFMEAWPAQKIVDSMTFNERFTDSDGHPHWWMAAGNLRHTLYDPLLSLCKIWFLSRAREKVQPTHALLFTEQRKWATLFASSYSDPDDFAWIVGSELPFSSREQWKGRWNCLARGFVRTVSLLWKILRKRLRDVCPGLRRTPPASTTRPTIVATTEFPRHFRMVDGLPQQWYWNNVADELQKQQPEADFRLLSQQIPYPAAPGLPKSPDELKQAELNVPLIIPGSFKLRPLTIIRLVYRHLAQLICYFRLERSEKFRSSFLFYGADVSACIVPHLRKMLRGALHWEYDVASTSAALESIGDVRAVLVHVEMYSLGMKVIAACRRLGMPSIGVQHGSIYPMHLMYTLPESLVREAPVPDFFACYGEFAGETLSKVGNYPRDRLQVVGAPRLDHLVANPGDKHRCRQATDIPDSKFVILITASAIAWEPVAVRHLLETVSNDPNICVCIKISPSGLGEAKYRQLAKKFSSVVDVRVYLGQMDELLNACDALASVVSTTILEAGLLGKPTICLNYTGQPEWYPFSREGLSLAAIDEESTRQAVAAVRDSQGMHETSRREFLARHVGPTLRGQGGETMARWIDDQFIA